MKIISRAEAKEKGLKYYFTSKPCKQRGHVAERKVDNYGCIKCFHAYRKKYDAERKEGRKIYNREYNEKNKKKHQLYQKEYYNVNKEERKIKVKQWRKANPGKKRATVAKRRAAKIQRTPLWADLERIKKIYQACPPWCVIDHVIPLQGELVSGLHVYNNLQYLTPLANSEKHNKFDLNEQR